MTSAIALALVASNVDSCHGDGTALYDRDMSSSKQRTKRLPAKHLQRLAEIVQPIVDEDFEGNQTRFGKAIGVSQSHVSQMLRGGTDRADRGIGLPVLIALRDYLRKTGRPYSLDELLALEPLEPPADAEARRLDMVVSRLESLLQSASKTPSREPLAPPPPSSSRPERKPTR